MTIATTDNKVLYTADGATVEFTFAFHTQDEANIYVYVNYVLDVAPTVLLNADQGTSPGGTVTFAAAPSNLDIVSIVRTMGFDQQTDYPIGGNFPSESHEAALDKLTLLTQQLDAVNSNAVRFPVSEDADAVLPVASVRANKYLSFDAEGDVDVSDSAASAFADDEEEWATKAEDSLISVAAGGDGATDYSALHWAAKSSDSADLADIARTGAELAETNTNAKYIEFDVRNLGVKSGDPSTDNQGGVLLKGAFYWHSVNDVYMVWDGAAFIVSTFVPTAAVIVSIADAGGYYPVKNVEAALQEIQDVGISGNAATATEGERGNFNIDGAAGTSRMIRY
nr:hypothetical protein [Spirochaetales bacterium]